MQHLSKTFRLLAVCALFSLGACKKQQPAAAENRITVSSRTAQPGQTIQARLSQADIARLKQNGVIRLEPQHEVSSANGAVSGGSGFQEWGGGNCPPVSQETLNYWQAQADACCCQIIVCLQGADCAYYMYAFNPGPYSGCGGGGGPWELQ